MNSFILKLCVVTAASVIALSPAAGSADRPNIVIILVDDMGFSDIGCYGSEIPTPHLDRLAANGLKFTQFYNTGRCCPTRATLLTGLYSHQAGIGHMTSDYGVPGYRGYLNDQCVTIADVARSSGYFTAISGKWHVGHARPTMWPTARGFDRFFGIPEGGGFYFKVKQGRSVVLNESLVYSPDQQPPDGWYTTDVWTEYGLNFVDEALEADKPFLLYVAHNAPHFPLQASADDINLFRGRYKEGWEAVSRKRYQRQLESGLLDARWKKSGRPTKVKPWKDLSTDERDKMDHLMAAYAACVHSMDRAVGELVGGLRARNQLDNTLILFMSDNGGCAEGGVYGKQIGDPTTAASNWYCGEAWAWVQDTPFRRYKHYNHEGGIATPLIAHWPNGIAGKGEWRHQPAHLIDIMATVADLTGSEYPERRGGRAIHPIPGTSLRPAFQNQALERDALYWEHEGNAAIRVGSWKLVRLKGRGPWELYNLDSDRTEQKNLAGQLPAKVDELKQKWLQWAQNHNVSVDGLPKKNK